MSAAAVAIALLCGATQGRASRPAGLALELDRGLTEFEEGQKLRVAEPDRARQLFTSAAQRFESLLAAGIANGYLEYNLGNSYLQAGDMGRAILHYRRAQRYIPRDPLLHDNLTVARTRCLLSVPPARASTLYRNLFFWHYRTSPGGRYAVALMAYALFWVLVSLRFLRPHRAWLWGAAIFGLLGVLSGGSYLIERWQDHKAPDGVVIAADVGVHTGPGQTYERQFTQSLQPGVEVRMVESRGDWIRIELSDGNSGWIPARAVEVIPPVPRDFAEIAISPS